MQLRHKTNRSRRGIQRREPDSNQYVDQHRVHKESNQTLRLLTLVEELRKNLRFRIAFVRTNVPRKTLIWVHLPLVPKKEESWRHRVMHKFGRRTRNVIKSFGHSKKG